MGKYIAATSYRFIAGLGLFGLVAALAIAQTSTGQFLRSTFHGVNSQPSPFFSSTQALPVTSALSQTTATGFFSPSTSALPITSGFTNPFTGVSVQSPLAQNISLTANGSSGVGSSTATSTGASATSGGTLSGSIVSGTAGSALGISGAGSFATGFTVLPSISSFGSGANSLTGGSTNGGASGANSVKGSFCGGYGI